MKCYSAQNGMKSGRKWIWNGLYYRAKVKSALMNTSPGCNGLATRHSGEAAFTKGGALMQSEERREKLLMEAFELLLSVPEEKMAELLVSFGFNP